MIGEVIRPVVLRILFEVVVADCEKVVTGWYTCRCATSTSR